MAEHRFIYKNYKNKCRSIYTPKTEKNSFTVDGFTEIRLKRTCASYTVGGGGDIRYLM